MKDQAIKTLKILKYLFLALFLICLSLFLYAVFSSELRRVEMAFPTELSYFNLQLSPAKKEIFYYSLYIGLAFLVLIFLLDFSLLFLSRKKNRK